jgi:large conductance mechanosensitive channel
MRIIEEFKDFMKEYKVLGLAVALIMGLAVNDLVKSLVNNMIMPIVSSLIQSESWQTATLLIGPINLGIGQFLAALFNFVIIAFVIFLIVKYFSGEKKEK